jgi:hypothetical protein
MIFRARNLCLCLVLLLVSGVAAGDGQASRAANQKLLPLALQYRQRILQIVETLPSSPANPATTGEPSVELPSSLGDPQRLPVVSASLYTFQSMQL